MVWAFAKDRYIDFNPVTENKFNNKQLKFLVGLGFELAIAEDIYLINEFLVKFPVT